MSVSTTKIIPIRAGVGTCYLAIQNNSFFLVDTSVEGHTKKIIKAIQSRGLNPSELKFIFLTHTHYDHAGNVSELAKITGAKVIVHSSETNYLSSGYHPIPKGTNTFFKFLVFLGRLNEKKRTKFKPVVADITFDESFDLSEFKINARLLHTPGHTKGSSCLIIDKYVFAGDAVFNIMGKIFPPFANDPTLLLQSWKSLISIGAEYYYPAHGKRLSFNTLSNAIK